MPTYSPIAGLIYSNNVYVHYSRNDFNKHRLQFSGLDKQYRQRAIKLYQQKAKKYNEQELESLKGPGITDVKSLIATFDEKNLDSIITNMLNSINIEGSGKEINAAADTTLNSDYDAFTRGLRNIDSVVNSLDEINTTLMDYLSDSNKANISGVSLSNLISIPKKSISNLNKIKSQISNFSSSGINGRVTYVSGSGKSESVPVSKILGSIKEELKSVISSTSEAIAVITANKTIISLDGSILNDIKITVSDLDMLPGTLTSDKGSIRYSDSDGQIIFNLATNKEEDEKGKKIYSFIEKSTLGNYMYGVQWQARYLTYNAIMHNNTYLSSSFYNYIAAKNIESAFNLHKYGTDLIFINYANELYSLSDFFDGLSNSNKLPSLSTTGSGSIPNRWIGRGRYGSDDGDNVRPYHAWIRAKRINSEMRNLKVQLNFKI